MDKRKEMLEWNGRGEISRQGCCSELHDEPTKQRLMIFNATQLLSRVELSQRANEQNNKSELFMLAF